MLTGALIALAHCLIAMIGAMSAFLCFLYWRGK